MGCCGSGSSPQNHKNDISSQHGTNNSFDADKSNVGVAKNVAGTAKSGLALGVTLVLVAGLFLGYFIAPSAPSEDHLAMIKDKSISEQREDWIAIADNIRGELARKGKYDCCLEKPCWYCIQKTPGHGEGAECTCRQDILNGLHPCGECIGEILEGHGLAELKPYYAKAIAHKVGAKHEAHLQEIINDMYPEAE